MQEIINVNIGRHGDGKQVFISIRTDKGDIVLRGDRVAVYIDPCFPNVLDPESQVSVWQSAT